MNLDLVMIIVWYFDFWKRYSYVVDKKFIHYFLII